MTDEPKAKKTYSGVPDPMAAALADEAAQVGADAEEVAESLTPASADPMAELAARTGIKDPAALRMIIEIAMDKQAKAHKAEVDALRQEIENVRTMQELKNSKIDNESLGGYPYQYYRVGPTFPDKMRHDWLVIAGGGASPKDGHRDTGSFQLYLKKGYIPITNYGLCPVPTDPEAWKNWTRFIEKGGAKEFPASQIVSYQWHKHNPFVKYGVRWTQVEPILDKLTRWQCEYCGYEMDFMPGDPMAGTAYRIHLTNADKVTFKEAIEAVKAQNLTTTPFRSRSIQEIIDMPSPNS